MTEHGALLPGALNFQVEEIAAYDPSGEGEHVYVWVRKQGLTTDDAARRLAQVAGCRPTAVGFAGRKDRHAITHQWFSLHLVEPERLAGYHWADADESDTSRSLTVITLTRHRNKLRLGHLRGNRFTLGLSGCDSQHLAVALASLAASGIANRFGTQRFGIQGANLTIARCWAAGDHQAAVAAIIDPGGEWCWGQPLPDGFRRDASGKVLGALRRGRDATSALRAGGEPLRKLITSAGQSAIFNAVLDARCAAGIDRAVRPGDIAIAPSGAPFTVTAADVDDVNERCASGDVQVSGPLPGTWRLQPDAAVVAEEQAWSAGCAIDWAAFGHDGALCAPGARRALRVQFLEKPSTTIDDGNLWLRFALPAGSYATTVLEQLSIRVPANRRGTP
ncbi:MAG: tRNA pseudouridine(13) synthase TruD [Planctomycetota bacterium]|jgi:tRNA pseudouridine13 synthase